MKTSEFYKRINDQLLVLEATCKSMVRALPSRHRQSFKRINRIPTPPPTTEDPMAFKIKFSTLGCYRDLFTELSFSPPELRQASPTDTPCKETDILAHYIRSTIGEILGEFYREKDIWHVSKTDIPLDEKRQFILDYLTSFVEAAQKCLPDR